MKNLEKTLLILGLILIVYSIFSRIYGGPGVALKQFKSTSVLLLANTVLILAILAKKSGK